MRHSSRGARSKTQSGRRRLAVLWNVGLLVLAVFTGFEVVHPTADLLHATAHRSDIRRGIDTVQTDDLPPGGLQGPFLVSGFKPDIQVAKVSRVAPALPSAQDSPKREPPTPVPIESSLRAVRA